MISIIGSGMVGSAIAFLVASNSLDDLVIVNRTKNKAIGEELDISNTIPKSSSINVVGTDDFSKIKNSKVIIISARHSPRSFIPFTDNPRNSKSILFNQIDMIKDIAKKIQPYTTNSIIIMISNPVDVLTYIFQKEINLSRDKVIGVGSSIDSNRFRYLLSKELKTNQSEITNTFVLGEHGDSMVPIFSLAKQKDNSVLDLLNESQVQKITKNLQSYWRTLREFKGRSVFGATKDAYEITKSIIKNEEIDLPASILLKGEFDISDVCVGVPIKIKKDSMMEIQEINLCKSELANLQRSAYIIRNFLRLGGIKN